MTLRADGAVEAAAPYVALAVDIAGKDRGRLPVGVVDGAYLGIVLFGGRAARDAGVLPQLQLGKLAKV